MLDSKKPDLNELEWIRIFDPIHIPKKLVEQIRDRDWSFERFFKYQKYISMHNGKDASGIEHLVINPFNFLFVLADKEKSVQGFLWAVIDELSNSLVINSFSIDRKYWGHGSAVSLLEKKAKEIAKGVGLAKIYWITNFPKHSERHGFNRSKSVLMEYNMNEDKNGKDIIGTRSSSDRTSKSDGTGTDAVLAEHSSGTRSSSITDIPKFASAI